MRELKFRVWNGHSMEHNVTVGKFGNFYVNPENGNGLNPKDSASLTTCTTKYHETTPVMQCTGLKDKNGKDIYEGDTVKFTTFAYEVFYNCERGAYDLKNNDGEIIIFAPEENKVEIVGNIYEKQTS